MRTLVDLSAKAVLRDVTSEGAADPPVRSFEIRDGARSREVVVTAPHPRTIDVSAIALPYPEVRLGPSAAPAPGRLAGTAKLDPVRVVSDRKRAAIDLGAIEYPKVDLGAIEYPKVDLGAIEYPRVFVDPGKYAEVPAFSRFPTSPDDFGVPDYELLELRGPDLPVQRSVQGRYDPDRVLDEGRAMSIELGSADGRATLSRLAVESVKSAGPASARTEPPPPATPEQRLERIVQREVLDAAAATDETDDLQVLVALEPLEFESLSHCIERRLAKKPGADVKQLRDAIVADRFEQTYRAQDAFVAQLEGQLGGASIHRFGFANILFVRVPRRTLRAMASRPDVVAVQFPGKLVQHAVDGVSVLAAHRVTPYLAQGYDGGHPNLLLGRDGISLAVIDFEFEDNHETIDGRVDQAWVCSSDGCDRVDVGSLDSDLVGYVRFLAPEEVTTSRSRHGTVCAQIAAGSPPASPSHAGASPQTRLFLYQLMGDDDRPFLEAMEQVALSGIDVVNASLGRGSPSSREPRMPGEEYGATPLCLAINALASNDVVWVNSAGNSGALIRVTSEGTWHYERQLAVTVRDPATAAFAIAVGGLLNGPPAEDIRVWPPPDPLPGTIGHPDTSQSQIESAGIFLASSRGGVPFLGGTRSVLATCGAAGQYTVAGTRREARRGMENFSAYDAYGEGTSFAAPIVAGAACDLRHFWQENAPRVDPSYPPAFINSLGFTIIQLLMMGDRQTETGVRTFQGFDPSFGNGRFAMRLFDNTHMNPPWRVHVQRLAIDREGYYWFRIDGGAPMPADVERLTVVLWWAEPPSSAAYVFGADITLHVTSAGGFTWSGDDSFDNKKRIYIPPEDFVPAHRRDPRWDVLVQVHALPLSRPERPAVRTLYLAWYYEGMLRLSEPIPERAPPGGWVPPPIPSD